MKKENNKISKPIALVIPANTAPLASGDYVLQEIKDKYPGIFVSVDTGTAISIVAVQGAKEKMRLKEVTLRLGASWLPVDLSFKWERKSEK